MTDSGRYLSVEDPLTSGDESSGSENRASPTARVPHRARSPGPPRKASPSPAAIPAGIKQSLKKSLRSLTPFSKRLPKIEEERKAALEIENIDIRPPWKASSPSSPSSPTSPLNKKWIDAIRESIQKTLAPVDQLTRLIVKLTSSSSNAPKSKYMEQLVALSWEKSGVKNLFSVLGTRPMAGNEYIGFKALLIVHHLLQFGSPGVGHQISMEIANLAKLESAKIRAVRCYASYLGRRVKFMQVQDLLGTLQLSGRFSISNAFQQSPAIPHADGKDIRDASKDWESVHWKDDPIRFIAHSLKAVRRMSGLVNIATDLIKVLNTAALNASPSAGGDGTPTAAKHLSQPLAAAAIAQIVEDVLGMYRLSSFLVGIAEETFGFDEEHPLLLGYDITVSGVKSDFWSICTECFNVLETLRASYAVHGVIVPRVAEPPKDIVDIISDPGVVPFPTSCPKIVSLDWEYLFLTFRAVLVSAINTSIAAKAKRDSIDYGKRARARSRGDSKDSFSEFQSISSLASVTSKDLGGDNSDDVKAEVEEPLPVLVGDPAAVVPGMNAVVLEEVIGVGGWSHVYRATWKGSKVAVKTLKKGKIGKKDLDDFEAEVAILKRLTNPHIVKYFCSCIDPKNPFLVTELLEMSLFDLIHNRHLTAWKDVKITWALRYRMAIDIAEGIKYLHSLSPPIIHRDLKSPNLLLDKSFRVKITDFGLSRIKAQYYTMTGNIGTYQWMAPEVMANKRYSEKADIYSFGMILWELIAAKIPFDGMEAMQAVFAVMSQGLRPKIPAETPKAYADLIEDCWQEVPEKRPGLDYILTVLHALKDTV